MIIHECGLCIEKKSEREYQNIKVTKYMDSKILPSSNIKFKSTNTC